LKREEARDMAAHLAFCVPCQNQVRELALAKGSLSAEPAMPFPENRIADTEAAVLKALSRPPGRPRAMAWGGLGLALAAAAALFINILNEPKETVSVDVFLAEHSRTLGRTAFHRRSASSPFQAPLSDNAKG
jgi:hypothetical protein